MKKLCLLVTFMYCALSSLLVVASQKQRMPFDGMITNTYQKEGFQDVFGYYQQKKFNKNMTKTKSIGIGSGLLSTVCALKSLSCLVKVVWGSAHSTSDASSKPDWINYMKFGAFSLFTSVSAYTVAQSYLEYQVGAALIKDSPNVIPEVLLKRKSDIEEKYGLCYWQKVVRAPTIAH